MKGRSDGFSHLAYGSLESHKNSVRDNAVADVEFSNLVNAGYSSDIAHGQAMTRGDVQTVLSRQRRAVAQTAQLLVRAHGAFTVDAATAQRSFGVSGGAQLNLLGVNLVRG